MHPFHRRHHAGQPCGHHFSHHGRGHRRGFGDESGFQGGPGRGLGGFERGRKLGSDDLQLLILALLAEQASHGYELIKAFDQRSRGYYVPSPGMIYPALSYLEEVGYATVEVEGAKKRYSVTVAGHAQVDEHRAAIDAMWAQLALFGDRMARLREEGDAAEPTDARGRHSRADGLHGAIDELRTLLRDSHHAAPQERQRIAAILAGATAAIRKARGG
jgi:DNA-binding PadR family transcriptional regulator